MHNERTMQCLIAHAYYGCHCQAPEVQDQHKYPPAWLAHNHNAFESDSHGLATYQCKRNTKETMRQGETRKAVQCSLAQQHGVDARKQ
eukprot:scaffold231958_cov15-Tisochrysis_lutea.AAC.1